jgi:hypothetical protein
VARFILPIIGRVNSTLAVRRIVRVKLSLLGEQVWLT